jgi:hypothetical protein
MIWKILLNNGVVTAEQLKFVVLVAGVAGSRGWICLDLARFARMDQSGEGHTWSYHSSAICCFCVYARGRNIGANAVRCDRGQCEVSRVWLATSCGMAKKVFKIYRVLSMVDDLAEALMVKEQSD